MKEEAKLKFTFLFAYLLVIVYFLITGGAAVIAGYLLAAFLELEELGNILCIFSTTVLWWWKFGYMKIHEMLSDVLQGNIRWL